MLTVRTEVQASPIAGLGLFAAEPIAAGQVWWKFDRRIDRTYTSDEFEVFPEHIQDWLRTYAYLQDGQWVLCGDHAKFVNHSDVPNSVTVGDESVALRDIAAGEEIVENYREFCEDWPLIPFLNADGAGKSDVPAVAPAA